MTLEAWLESNSTDNNAPWIAHWEWVADESCVPLTIFYCSVIKIYFNSENNIPFPKTFWGLIFQLSEQFIADTNTNLKGN